MNRYKLILPLIILFQSYFSLSQQKYNLNSCCDVLNDYKPNLAIKKKHINFSETYSSYLHNNIDSSKLEEKKQYDKLGRIIEYKYKDEENGEFYIQKYNWTSDSTIDIKIIFENNSDSIICFRKYKNDGSKYISSQRLSFDSEGKYFLKYKLLLNSDYTIYKVYEFDFNSKLINEYTHPLSTRFELVPDEIIIKDSIFRKGRMEMFHLKSKYNCASISDTLTCKNQNDIYTVYEYNSKNKIIKKVITYYENNKISNTDFIFYSYDSKNRIIQIKSNKDNGLDFYKIHTYSYKSKHKLKEYTYDIDLSDSLVEKRYLYNKNKILYFYTEKINSNFRTTKTYYQNKLPTRIEYFNNERLNPYYIYYLYK